MTSYPYYRWLPRFQQWSHTLFRVHFRQKQLLRPSLDQLAQRPDLLPRFVRASPVAMRYLHFLGVLDWSHFPERDLDVQWTLPPIPFAPFPDPMIGDAILDRLIHNAYRLELQGESRRKIDSPLPMPTT